MPLDFWRWRGVRWALMQSAGENLSMLGFLNLAAGEIVLILALILIIVPPLLGERTGVRGNLEGNHMEIEMQTGVPSSELRACPADYAGVP